MTGEGRGAVDRRDDARRQPGGNDDVTFGESG